MSEITTGAVPLSLIGAPLAVGSACVDAVYFAGKYCVDQYQKMLEEIEKGNERLKWLDKQSVSSPAEMKEEATRLQKMVAEHTLFNKMTNGISAAQKDILAGAIATRHSPLKAYVPVILKDLDERENAFQVALNQGTKNLALDNFRYVNDIVKDAAKATGFNGEVKVLKNTESISDVVFSDKLNRKLTAYCKLDKSLNPVLMMDLEGFLCDDHECSAKMDEIVNYLQTHGVPFFVKRIKHNQPMGVLRSVINKKKAENKDKEIIDYLKGGNSTRTLNNKQK